MHFLLEAFEELACIRKVVLTLWEYFVNALLTFA